MANAIGNNGGRIFSFGAQPVLIDCNFVVDATNGNGLGINSLKGQGVRSVYMATSASFTGTTHSGTNVIDGIAGGTASLKVNMPISGTGIPAGTIITAITGSGSITVSNNSTGSNSSETISYVGVGNKLTNTNVATTSKGLAWIRLRSNYNRYLGGFSGFVSPSTGSTIKIDAADAALTVGSPYIIASVGVGPSGAATIAPVADSSGSLSGTYFMLYDSYGNSFCLWFYVTGVGGSAPNLGPQVAQGQRGLQYVQVTIAQNAAATAITTALSGVITLLPSGVNGVFSFTASGGGGATLTVTSTATLPLGGIPQDGNTAISTTGGLYVPIYFTISTGSATSGSVWTDGNGNLYTASATISSATLFKTTGTTTPATASGTLTFVSGTGSTTSLTYSSVAAGYATGFTFALTVSDTNLSDWQGVGLPAGLTPTVGQSFVATATGSGGSTGTVVAVGTSGIGSIEVIGDPNQSFAPSTLGGPSAHEGGWVLIQFLAPTNSSTTTPVKTAPTNLSVVGLSFYVDARLSPSNTGPH